MNNTYYQNYKPFYQSTRGFIIANNQETQTQQERWDQSTWDHRSGPLLHHEDSPEVASDEATLNWKELENGGVWETPFCQKTDRRAFVTSPCPAKSSRNWRSLFWMDDGLNNHFEGLHSTFYNHFLNNLCWTHREKQTCSTPHQRSTLWPSLVCHKVRRQIKIRMGGARRARSPLTTIARFLPLNALKLRWFGPTTASNIQIQPVDNLLYK